MVPSEKKHRAQLLLCLVAHHAFAIAAAQLLQLAPVATHDVGLDGTISDVPALAVEHTSPFANKLESSRPSAEFGILLPASVWAHLQSKHCFDTAEKLKEFADPPSPASH